MSLQPPTCMNAGDCLQEYTSDVDEERRKGNQTRVFFFFLSAWKHEEGKELLFPLLHAVVHLWSLPQGLVCWKLCSQCGDVTGNGT